MGLDAEIVDLAQHANLVEQGFDGDGLVIAAVNPAPGGFAVAAGFGELRDIGKCLPGHDESVDRMAAMDRT
ncbi:hypothetical protein D3C72_2394100 [compost metagenome]